MFSKLRFLFSRGLTESQTKKLLAKLTNPAVDSEDREDIATALIESDAAEVETAFVQVASQQTATDSLKECVGECLASIWIRKGAVNLGTLAQLTGPARSFALGSLRNNSKELYDQAVSQSQSQSQ